MRRVGKRGQMLRRFFDGDFFEVWSEWCMENRSEYGYIF
jgi:hypothetical protein